MVSAYHTHLYARQNQGHRVNTITISLVKEFRHQYRTLDKFKLSCCRFKYYSQCITWQNVLGMSSTLECTLKQMENKFIVSIFGNEDYHCIKYTRIRVFTDPHSSVQGQNLPICSYTGEQGSAKTSILAYFMQCMLQGTERNQQQFIEQFIINP